MAGMRKGMRRPGQAGDEQPPEAGATRQALDNDVPYDQSSGYNPGEEDAAGTPGGGTEVGGLAGTNIGDGAPENAHLEEAMPGNGPDEYDAGNDMDEGDAALGGPSGGAVGGTPAGKRSSGGHRHRGIAPGGEHRGDSTVGADPDKK